MSQTPNPDDTPEEHRARMAKVKAIRDAEVRQKKIRRGVSHAPALEMDAWSGQSRLRRLASARLLDHAQRRCHGHDILRKSHGHEQCVWGRQ